MFVVAKIVAFLLTPLVLVLALFAVSVLAAWNDRRRLSRLTGIPALAMTLVLSATPVAEVALRSLEDRHPQVPSLDLDSVAGAIVLGGAQGDGDLVAERGRYLLNGRAERLTAVLELRLRRPDMPIVAVGGSGRVAGAALSEAQISRLFFDAVGVDPASILYEGRSRSTIENAAFAAPLLPRDPRPWLLVTSASHMPRAVMIFEGQGIETVPYPVDYVAPRPSWSVHRISVAKRFDMAGEALREYLGIAHFRLFLAES